MNLQLHGTDIWRDLFTFDSLAYILRQNVNGSGTSLANCIQKQLSCTCRQGYRGLIWRVGSPNKTPVQHVENWRSSVSIFQPHKKKNCANKTIIPKKKTWMFRFSRFLVQKFPKPQLTELNAPQKWTNLNKTPGSPQRKAHSSQPRDLREGRQTYAVRWPGKEIGGEVSPGNCRIASLWILYLYIYIYRYKEKGMHNLG